MARTGPKRDLEAQRRILDATASLLADHGPRRVSINDIAAAAGVGKQTIYRWWPSKSAVVIDALERQVAAVHPPPDTGSAREDIRLQMRRVAAMFTSPTGAVIRELVAEAQGDEHVAEELRRRFVAERRRRSAAVVRAGIERGELRPDLDVETVIDLLYAPLWFRLLIGHEPLSRRAADRLLDHVWPALVAAPSVRGR